LKTPDVLLNYNKSSKNGKPENNSNDKFLPQNKIIRVINSRQLNNQIQKPFGYSTENYFTGQKYFFNSNIINNKNNNGILKYKIFILKNSILK